MSDSSWKSNKSKLEHVELIPGFDEEEIIPIRQSLRQTGLMGSAYDKLSPIQQQWIHVHQVGGMYYFGGSGRSHYEEPHLTANPSKFEKTTCKTIALEIREFNSRYSGKTIHSGSMDQLIRILNYAHDQGGRRIILINQTSFNTEQLLAQIKENLPSAERERTWSRLMLLLCETEDSIFEHNEFNGHIKKTIPESKFVDVGRKDLDHGLLFAPSAHSNRYSFQNRKMSMPLIHSHASRRSIPFSDNTDGDISAEILPKLVKAWSDYAEYFDEETLSKYDVTKFKPLSLNK